MKATKDQLATLQSNQEAMEAKLTSTQCQLPARQTSDAPKQSSAATQESLKREKARNYAKEYAARNKTKGSTTAAAERKTSTQTTVDLTHVLFSLHRMGAVLLQSPVFVITEDEAKLLANAITRVTDLYEIPLLDEKSRAVDTWAMAGVEVYGTRIAAVVMEKKRTKPQLIPFEQRIKQETPPPPAPDGEAHASHA